ncbi:hypothetical protein [Rhodohalobacter sulfatireducens]|uniref:Uncharacterized protein n=1 Tax=Rhodohalobacter sulfatireducens TaxID=2911366 RepID=A0ABS9K943_9BACT|nr:hypothetical protein [Rhodohalobacter sulfatireducens]MCG2587332.1 hypothetical protein [Rhodohalobacter sulfatireducens]MDR9366987.1 hypothetical protein [Balneolaceae bacterium]MDR9410983.1 hypothetical protein [Balneolaceae bacterium]
MNSEVWQIKIKLDVPQEVIEYFQLEQQWENEGGAITKNEKAEIEHDIKAPLKPGMCYYVMDGRFEIQDNNLLYVADIHPDYNG